MKSIQNIMEISNIDNFTNKVCEFIKYEVQNNLNKKGAVVGLSGGIDSAVTAALCARSIGSENVLGLILPEQESDSQSEILATSVAEKFNLNFEVINITPILESFGVYRIKEQIVKEKFSDFDNSCKYRVMVPPKSENSVGIPFLEIFDNEKKSHKFKISSKEFLTLTAATSIKHRVRMTLLYFCAEKNNFSVIGTTNKSEYLQGYFVKYGDGGSDIEPLVNIYKSQIYQLGNFLDVPKRILSKNASPDVWSLSTNDEEFFYSVPYDVVDLILYAREQGLSETEVEKISDLSLESIQSLFRMQNMKELQSKHMREIPHHWEPDFT